MDDNATKYRMPRGYQEDRVSGRRTDFFGRPRLPHKCGVPVGVGTPHLCGSEEICLAARVTARHSRRTTDRRFLPRIKPENTDKTKEKFAVTQVFICKNSMKHRETQNLYFFPV